MAQVAEVVGVHETTVSRAVNGKYMETPRGVFELRTFFTGGLATDSGEGMASSSGNPGGTDGTIGVADELISRYP